MKLLSASLLSALLLAGCGGNDDIVVTAKAVRHEPNVSAAVPSEFGGTTPALGEIYWAEGQVLNSGAEAVKNVVITFRCTDGSSQKRLLVATIAGIAPGQTVPFRSERLTSQVPIKFTDDEPEITVGK